MITSKVLSEKSKKEQYSLPNNNNKAATSTDTIQKLITISFKPVLLQQFYFLKSLTLI